MALDERATAMRKDQMTDVLRGLLRDVLRARFEGTQYAKLPRVHGYADGYMRALIDTGLFDQKELVALVGAERQRFVDDLDAPQTSIAAA